MTKEKVNLNINLSLPFANSTAAEDLTTKVTYSAYYTGIMIEKANAILSKHLDFLHINGKVSPITPGELEDAYLLLNLAKSIVEYVPDYASSLERMLTERDKAEAESNPDAETGKFIDRVFKAEVGSEERFALARHYTEEMRRAVDHGRICTPERMIALYPIFREINIEQDEARELEAAEQAEYEKTPSEKPPLDLSSQPENLDITAEQFSALINKPDLPKEFQTILDTYCEVKQ